MRSFFRVNRRPAKLKIKSSTGTVIPVISACGINLLKITAYPLKLWSKIARRRKRMKSEMHDKSIPISIRVGMVRAGMMLINPRVA